jgi:ATP-dependent exoDNAse (exonuclease V) alpha subunit
MRVYRVNDEFNVVHEQSQKMYETIFNSIVNNCSKLGWSWRGKYFFEEQFGQINYNHALTIHKSQGSTYKEVVLNVGDINTNHNFKGKERKRMLYTGVTRAAKLLILNNV